MKHRKKAMKGLAQRISAHAATLISVNVGRSKPLANPELAYRKPGSMKF